MKSKLIFIILSLLWATLSLAQTADIRTTLNQISDSGKDWELNFSLNLNFSPAEGFVLQLPEKILLVPVSIQVNNKNMWLQKKTAIPDRDSVVTWEFTSQGLSLFFRNGSLKNGDALGIKCHASFSKTDIGQNTVELKEAFLTPSGIEVSDQNYASGTIPLTSNQEEN